MKRLNTAKGKPMYQINLRAQVNKLAALTIHWPFARVQQPAAQPRLRAALAELADAATLHVRSSNAAPSTQRRDPRDPCNW
jgi:hypothetical protein